MKRRRFFKLLLPVLSVVALLSVFVSGAPVLGATSQDVTVTATPEYIAITNAPSTWTVNGITGSGVIQTDTVYYSNPLGDTTAPSATVVDGECRFTLTDNSSVNIDLVVNWGDFSGGDANMTNSDTGSNGATTFGAYSWHSGMTYSSKVIAQTTGSSDLKSNHSGSLKWGAEIETQTNAWTGGSASTSTLTISATAS